MSRPKIYADANEAKKAAQASKIKGRYFFLTIPGLQVSDEEIEKLKQASANLLQTNQKKHNFQHYGIVREAHHDGSWHLHLYVQYAKPVTISLKHYDYLKKHPNIQRVRSLNQVLDYLTKQDLNPCFSKGFNPRYEIDKKTIEHEPFKILQQAMLKNPLTFNPHQWLADNNLTVAASRGNWPKAINLVRKQQQVEANRLLRSSVGIKKITRDFIESSLTPLELTKYDSWDGYQKIVDHLNDIPIYGFNRPHKKRNLMIVGRPNTGKTTLARKIRQYVAVYSFGVENWFPRYQNWVYPMILWNQFYLKAMPYGQLLNVLEGEPTDLPYKGGSILKRDNQLVYITSNMSLEQHVCNRFKDQDKRALARANLSARIEEVTIREDKDLFLLLKLIKPESDTKT